jgi:selenide,water dikinase
MAMTPTTATVYRDLVLVGGGHAHAQVIKMWGMQPLPGVRLTLISPQVQTPYSGMLPGLIAGHYSFDDTHIDLMRLCQFAGARFIQASVERLDLEQRELWLANDPNRPAIVFDLLSINSGITPDLSLPGIAEFATPVKPISALYPRWHRCLEQLREGSEAIAISVVGGGAAGVELILAMHHAIQQQRSIRRPVKLHLVYRGNHILSSYPERIRKPIEIQLRDRGIQLHANCEVIKLSAQSIHFKDTVAPLRSEHTFWCTQASAAAWPQQSGLATDSKGFISLLDTLQSSSHDFVFAAGDIAQQSQHPRPSAGVFAVRQGPVLFKNLQSKLLKMPLQQHRPQHNFLSILALGEQYAIAHHRFLPTLRGEWVWRWKNRIDQAFMAMFSKLAMSKPKLRPAVTTARRHSIETPISDLSMRCGGCGAKVGATILSTVIRQLQPVQRDEVVWGLNSPDDAAAIRISSSNADGQAQLLLQSADQFRAIIDEPYLLGQIAAQHALSDLFAMNAAPQSALALASLPYSADKITERELLQLMSGAVKVLNDNNCSLTGGHSSEASELSIGFAVNGLAAENAILKKTTPQAGHVLMMTQALGTGTLFAAHGQLQAQGKWLEAAIAAMLLSNRHAGEIFHAQGATACTDITGFGLIGHLAEMLKPSGLSARLRLNNIPALEGALACLAMGIHSSLQEQNQRLNVVIKRPGDWQHHPAYPLLFDPQTSGGLLASVPADRAENCLQALQEAGYSSARIIGEIYCDAAIASTIELRE